MAKIGFIGLGNMGLPMAQNLIKAGHAVRGFDVSRRQVDALVAAGGTGGRMACAPRPTGAEVVITMLPAGKHVREVYLGDGGVLSAAGAGHAADRFLDHRCRDRARGGGRGRSARTCRCSTRRCPAASAARRRGTLTFMVGGSDAAFARAKPILDTMGKTIVHAGGAGNGQAAKICNNMILGVSMIAVSEAFVLAEKLGLDAQKLFDISSKSSGQCWSMTAYCPVPGPVPTSPANRDYQGGLHRRDDAEGSEACAGRRQGRRRQRRRSARTPRRSIHATSKAGRAARFLRRDPLRTGRSDER